MTAISEFFQWPAEGQTRPEPSGSDLPAFIAHADRLDFGVGLVFQRINTGLVVLRPVGPPGSAALISAPKRRALLARADKLADGLALNFGLTAIVGTGNRIFFDGPPGGETWAFALLREYLSLAFARCDAAGMVEFLHAIRAMDIGGQEILFRELEKRAPVFYEVGGMPVMRAFWAALGQILDFVNADARRLVLPRRLEKPALAAFRETQATA